MAQQVVIESAEEMDVVGQAGGRFERPTHVFPPAGKLTIVEIQATLDQEFEQSLIAGGERMDECFQHLTVGACPDGDEMRVRMVAQHSGHGGDNAL